MIVEAVHPAIAVHVPFRGRGERLDLVACRTPVELRAIGANEAGAVDPGYGIPGQRPLLRHGGLLWRSLLRAVGADRAAMPAADFARWLRGEVPGNHHLEEAFAGTPLIARHPHGLGSGDFDEKAVLARPGQALDLDRSRAVRRDDRDRAPPALRAFLDRNVLLIGGIVHVREAPLAVFRGGGPATLGLLGISGARRLGGFREFAATPASFEAMRDYAFRRVGSVSHSPDIVPWSRIDFGDGDGAPAQRWAADTAFGPVARLCDRVAARIEGGEAIGILAAQAAALREAALDSMTGLRAEEDPRRDLQAIRDAIAFALPREEGRPYLLDGPELLRDAIEALYLPTLPAPALDPDDVAALEAAALR